VHRKELQNIRKHANWQGKRRPYITVKKVQKRKEISGETKEAPKQKEEKKRKGETCFEEYEER